MNSLRSLIPVGLMAVCLGGAAGCDKKETPKAEPASTGAPKGSANARSKLNIRNPMGPVNRIDPQTMKEYRLEVCYYGTLSLRQARDAYLGSLGKDEPSEKKLPSFGLPAAAGAPPAPAPGASASPAASGAKAPAAKPPAPAASASAAPAASGAAPLTRPERKSDLMVRAPHERNARACTAGMALKEPAMGDVDAALAAYAPLAVDLAKDITAANTYYQQEEYKKDAFAKGKELDKKLREGFGKLDELEDKLGNALAAWRAGHTPDAAKMEEGEKTARTAIEAARDVVMMVITKKADGEAYKAASDKLDKAVEALKTYASGHAADPWAKITVAPFEGLLKTVKEAKVTADKTFDAEASMALVTGFTNLVEAKQRAISRAAMAKAAPGKERAPGAHAPAAPGAPAPVDQPAPH